MSAKVWALGDAVVDLLPDGHGRLLQCPGGAPANVAVGVARLGGASGFIGRVGRDPFGAFMTQTLKDENVDTRAMHQDPAHRTSTVVVALDDRGERSFTFMVRPSADLFLTADDLPPFGAGEWLHVCSIALCAQPSRDTAFEATARIKRAGGFVSFDPNIREDLWPNTAQLRECVERALAQADVVKLSLEELAFIAGSDDKESALALARRHAIPLLLITRGAEGVDACFNDALHHYPAVPVECVDTTGAGDAFVAGLLWSLAAHGLPEDTAQLAPVLAAAQACGALATTAKGAMTALPRLDDLQPYLA
ncbi:aminoimidazole riboside kinase [Cronobacter turicensis]|uniref:aminoimidazole riboside kinase n=1 Tax=Cronobacter turicensis TaxID=413502 RepID=UPI001D8FD830|nr:aminoimidazole riboside kinase [Cronobacter turicensis]EGT4492034.1 aminoimidazole riboside kinase [Cronobacter turicensis]EKM0436764.1 aminoimidazole riboside kinase [Cronobacter turicensis]ELY4321018.1 aminoimidazole riboside kinase [Cronobacter turicensis]ELY5941995.1 aminoimidazole riboside kinase [Cronobacter turicensis]ELY5962085.1 aminoimidazole riboside kinase [Cronobacter turicensis]